LKTLKQIFSEHSLYIDSTIEKRIIDAVKEWLQQKQVPIKTDAIFQDEEIRQRFLEELLEELK